MFPWFFMSLEVCIAVFPSEVIFTFSVFITWFRREVSSISPASDSEAFWLPLITPHPHFSLPLVAEPLGLSAFSWSAGQPTMYRLSSSCFAKGGTEAQVCGFSLAGRFGSAVCVCSPVISQILLLPLLSGARRGLATGSGAICGWGMLSTYGSEGKESACNAGDLGLEEEMATHSRTLPGRIPWT